MSGHAAKGSALAQDQAAIGTDLAELKKVFAQGCTARLTRPLPVRTRNGCRSQRRLPSHVDQRHARDGLLSGYFTSTAPWESRPTRDRNGPRPPVGRDALARSRRRDCKCRLYDLQQSGGESGAIACPPVVKGGLRRVRSRGRAPPSACGPAQPFTDRGQPTPASPGRGPGRPPIRPAATDGRTQSPCLILSDTGRGNQS